VLGTLFPVAGKRSRVRLWTVLGSSPGCGAICGMASVVVSLTDEHVHIRGFAIDLETNASTEYEDQFKRLVQRKGRDGETHWVQPDERDLRELIGRRGAILVRNAILSYTPA